VAKKTDNEKEIVRLIRDYGIVRECIPTKWLNSVDVWEALLENMPITAMIRNLGKMTSIGLLKPLSSASRKVVETIQDEKILLSGRVHPLNVLVALRTYQNGHGDKGSLTWTPNQQIVSALDSAFYTSFGAVEPTNKGWMLALDCSASMTWQNCCGMQITPREASAAMAMLAMKTEKNHLVTGFTSGSGISELPVNSKMALNDVVDVIQRQNIGGTDCSLPMQYATAHNLQVDVFVVYTDNETRHGIIHPIQALRKYREKTGNPAKLVVCGATSTEFTIADP
jgi:60 kDa SS-A/Ro ribonucleoprotein